MKAAITGHTKGLGKSFLTHLESKGYQVLGFSRSNGYNIEETATQKKIIDVSQDCDIFINNAHHGFSQTELFSRAWNQWKNTAKIIISISSISVYLRNALSGPQHPLGHSHYAAEKAGLDHAHYWAWQDTEASAQSVLVRPGLIDTPRVKWTTINAANIKEPMDPEKLAGYILNTIIDCPYLLREITVWHRKKDA